MSITVLPVLHLRYKEYFDVDCKLFSESWLCELMLLLPELVLILFSVCQGHIETIFDCQFHPDDPDILATGSFDGTIKIWDMTTLKPVTFTAIRLLLLE